MIELSYFDYKDNHIIWNITKLAEDSSLFSHILTVESDLQAQFAANRSNHTALTALIRLSFFLRYSPQTKLLRSVPIRELVCTAIGATKRSVGFCIAWHIINERDKVVYDRWFVGHVSFCKQMYPVGDAIFTEFWTVTPWHTTKEVVDSRGYTFLCAEAQFHLMGNSHDAVVDGCCFFVVEVRSVWKCECSEDSTSFCDETIENVLVSVLLLCSKSSLTLSYCFAVFLGKQKKPAKTKGNRFLQVLSYFSIAPRMWYE